MFLSMKLVENVPYANYHERSMMVRLKRDSTTLSKGFTFDFDRDNQFQKDFHQHHYDSTYTTPQPT